MKIPKVIVTEQIKIADQDIFEIEVGLSSYDLALISINKIANKSKSYTNDSLESTFLI